MESKLKIKVIKKNSVRINQSPEVTGKATEENQKREAMSKVILTVSDWVAELQKRRDKETKQSFDRMFLKINKLNNV